MCVCCYPICSGRCQPSHLSVFVGASAAVTTQKGGVTQEYLVIFIFIFTSAPPFCSRCGSNQAVVQQTTGFLWRSTHAYCALTVCPASTRGCYMVWIQLIHNETHEGNGIADTFPLISCRAPPRPYAACHSYTVRPTTALTLWGAPKNIYHVLTRFISNRHSGDIQKR